MSLPVSGNEIRFVKSLERKKARDENGMFVVEGAKLVEEALRSSFEVVRHYRMEDIETGVMERMTLLNSPSPALAIVRKPKDLEINDLKLSSLPEKGLFLALDGIQDPGNMGTMIRTADAAGFDGLLLSPDCVDIFSPKVLRATMGSIFRMTFAFPDDLPSCLRELREKGFSVLSSQLDGEPFYDRENVSSSFVLIVGNEGNGISEPVKAEATHRLRLPMRGGAESLNAAVAAGIMMYDLMKNA